MTLAVNVLIAVTLLGVVPMYRRLALPGPRAAAPMAMFERFTPHWLGRVLTLAVFGFAAAALVLAVGALAAGAAMHVAGGSAATLGLIALGGLAAPLVRRRPVRAALVVIAGFVAAHIAALAAGDVLLLWFAAVLAMVVLVAFAGRGLPAFGMRTAASGVLTAAGTATALGSTALLHADVRTMVAACAVDLVVLAAAAAVAVTLTLHREGNLAAVTIGYGAISVLLVDAAALGTVYRPEGALLAGALVLVVVAAARLSWLVPGRGAVVPAVELDPVARRLVDGTAGDIHLAVVDLDGASRPDVPVTFALYIEPGGAPGPLRISGQDGPTPVLRVRAAAPAEAVAAVTLRLRDRTGRRTHAYYRWTEASRSRQALRFLLLGDGAGHAQARALLRRAEPDPGRRPRIHVC